MTNHPLDTYYIPLLMGAAGVLAGCALPAFGITIFDSLTLAAILILFAGVLAYRTQNKNASQRGGRGGSATSIGDRNTAIGGKGGDANGGTGGDGGSATVQGNNSVVKGGDGGTG